MPRISYTNIVRAVQNVLLSDSSLDAYSPDGIRVLISDKLGQSIAEQAPCIIIERRSRDVPRDRQVLRAGTKTVFTLNLVLTCIEYDLSSIEAGHEKLDELISLAEIALMKDRTLGGACENFTLDGGNFDSTQSGNHFIVGAEIKMAINASTSY